MDSAILEVAIGLAFVFLLFSLLVSAATELLAGWLRWRGRHLWEGLGHLMQSEEARNRLYNHALIKGLARVDRDAPDWRDGRNGPSYIPSRTFALALVDVLRRADERRGRGDTRSDGDVSGSASSTAKVPGDWPDVPPAMKGTMEALAPLWEEAGDDAERFQKNIERWFDDGMDRVSGWYRRHTAYWQGGIALVIAILLNVDALLITRTLWREPTLRRSLVASAEAYEAKPAGPLPREGQSAQPGVVPDPDKRFADLQAQIGSLGVPIGWSCEEHTIANWLWCVGGRAQGPGREKSGKARPDPAGERSWLAMIVGWLIMAAAASLGAPFWFDTLKRFMSVRSGGKPPVQQRA